MKLYLSSARRRGVALIIVMMAMFVLTVIVGAFAYAIKVELRLAQNANNESDLVWLGRSGVEFARYVLAQQMAIPGEPYDSLNQKWAGGPGTLAASNSPLAYLSLENIPVGNGTITVKIKDLERKFNINIMDEGMLQQVLGVVGLEASEAGIVSSSILDWIDPDNVARINGAESDYYETIIPPYSAKNKPLDDLAELLLVRGVTREMYWGANSTNHEPAAFQRVDRHGRIIEEPIYSIGLADVFTPISNGKVNINTASAEVLAILFGGDHAIAQQVVMLRSGPDGIDGTEDDTPAGSNVFRVEDLLLSAGVNRQAIPAVARFLTTRSSAFEVEILAETGGSRRTFHAILGRTSPRDVQILSFHWQ